MSIGMAEYLSGQYESAIATFGTKLNPELDSRHIARTARLNQV